MKRAQSTAPGLPARRDGKCITCQAPIVAGETRVGYLRGEQICVDCVMERKARA